MKTLGTTQELADGTEVVLTTDWKTGACRRGDTGACPVAIRRGDQLVVCSDPSHGSEEDRMARAREFSTLMTNRGGAGKSRKQPQACQCGCEGQTKGGRFLPGHDARLRGNLVRQYQEAQSQEERDQARERLLSMGWGHAIERSA